MSARHGRAVEEVKAAAVGGLLILNVTYWHLRNMPTAPENVCALGNTGSDKRAARTTRLTQQRHSVSRYDICRA
jgi:hypothetical protein